MKTFYLINPILKRNRLVRKFIYQMYFLDHRGLGVLEPCSQRQINNPLSVLDFSYQSNLWLQKTNLLEYLTKPCT